MRVFLGFGVLLVVAAAVLCSFGSAEAAVNLSTNDKNQIRRCVGYMLVGPQYNGLELKGQGFNCKPVKAKMVGSNLVVTGQLSHQLTLRPDDQVNFTMEFAQDGTLVKHRVTIEDGGFVKVVKFLLGTELTGVFLEGLPQNLGTFGGIVDVVSSRIASKVANNWTGYSQLMLAGLQVQISQGLVNSTRAPSFFMDHPFGDLSAPKLEVNRDYAGTRVLRADPFSFLTACSNLCSRTRGCRAWTFLRSDRRCYLKNSDFRSRSFNAEGITAFF